MSTYIVVNIVQKIVFSFTRKNFLINEMNLALDSRIAVYSSTLIDYCKNINLNYKNQCSFTESFTGNFTYGEYDICVSWDTYNRKYEFTLAPKYDTIACIHFPGESS